MKSVPLYKNYKISTLRELVDCCAAAYRGRTAFRYERGSEMHCVTFDEFKQQVDDIGAYLRHAFGDKRHIAVLGENSYEWILTHFAVTCGGNVIVPIDKELSADVIAELLKNSDCELLIYSDTYVDVVQALPGPMPQAYAMSELSGMASEGKEFLDRDKAGSLLCTPGKDDLATIVFTSGTTGQFKGVMLTHGNLASDAHGGCCNDSLTGTGLLVLPLHHTFGLVAGVFSAMLSGCAVYINKSLKRIADDMRLCHPQHVCVVPLIVEQLNRNIWLNAKKQKKDKMLRVISSISDALLPVGIDLRFALFKSVHEAFGGNLRLLVCGGAPIDEKTIRSLRSLGIAVLNGYGITECGPIVTVNRNKREVAGSVGYPLNINEVRIADDGEILVKGSNVMPGYYRNEHATKEAFEGEWFKTGDLGRLDERGALYIIGRKKNLIILSNGENVPAEELEMKLLSIPSVLEAIVYCRNDAITAELFLDSDISNAKDTIHGDVRSLNKTLPQNRCIADIVLRDEPFPKTTSKKIKRGNRG